MTFTGYGVKYGISYKTEIIDEMKVNIYAPASPKTYIFYLPSSLYSNSYFYDFSLFWKCILSLILERLSGPLSLIALQNRPRLQPDSSC